MDVGRSRSPDQERAAAGRVTGRRASPDGGAISASAKRVIALGVTQFAAFAVVLAVGWAGGPGHPGPPAPTPTVTVTVTVRVTATVTVTVTKTKIDAPAKHHSPPGTHAPTSTPTPNVVAGQGSS
jgi:hypothetical protein